MKSFRRAFIGTLFWLHAWSLSCASSIVTWGNSSAYDANVPVGLTNAVKLAGGFFHILALKDNGTIAAWGAGGVQLTNIPAGLSNIVDVAAGVNHNLVLKSDGSLVSWGGGPVTNIPTGLTNVVAIAAGNLHSVAVTADGVLREWGNYSGGWIMNTPTNIGPIKALSCGHAQTVVLRPDGSIFVWGDNATGEVNVPPEATNIVAVTSGGHHILALRADGKIIAWGSNQYGETNVPTGLSNIVRIAAGQQHSLALQADGALGSWGYHLVTNVAPAFLTNAAEIIAGGSYAAALTGLGAPKIFQSPRSTIAVAGDLVVLKCAVAGSWDTTTQWFLNDNALIGQTNQMLALENVLPQQAGIYHLVATNSAGSVTSSDAVLTVLPFAFTQQPTNINAMGGDAVAWQVQARNIGPFSYQWRHESVDLPGATNTGFSLSNVALADAGNYSVLVSNTFGARESAVVLTVVPISLLQQPTNLTKFNGSSAVFSVAAWKHGPFNYQWRFAGADLPGETNATLVRENITPDLAGDYSVRVSNPYGTIESSNATLSVLADFPTITQSPSNQTSWPGGIVNFSVGVTGSEPFSYQWRRNGVNISGATNAGLTLSSLVVTQAGNYSVIVSNQLGAVTSGSGVLTVVPVVAWGGNSSGQTNVPATLYQTSAGLTNVTGIAAGYGHSIAIVGGYPPSIRPGKAETWGGVVPTPIFTYATNLVAAVGGISQSWGLRSNGTVVTWGNNQNNATPVLSNIVAIAAAYDPTAYALRNGLLAIKSDGTVVTAGSLGWYNGLTNVPSGLNSVVGVALGQYHYMALRSDGRVTGWQDYADYGANVVPNGLSNVVAIAAGISHSLALRADGTVRAWQGQSRAALTNLPVGLSNVVAISAGSQSSLALKSDGTLVSWGYGSFGETNVPVALSNVVAIASGYQHHLALVNVTNRAIVRPPQSCTGLPRQPVLLSVGVTSRDPITYQWQFNGTNISGATNSFYRIPALSRAEQGGYRVLIGEDPAGPPPLTSAVAQVTMTGNSVIAWGLNNYGQTNIPTDLNAVTIAAGSFHSALLFPDGRVRVWGGNSYAITNIPTTVTNVVALAAGDSHTLALKSDGRVVGWGTLGAAPSTLSNVVAVAGGYSHSLALKSDGKVTQWPTAAPTTLSNVSAIAASIYSLALHSDGTLTQWNSGPAIPPDVTNAIAISAGKSSSAGLAFGVALLSNGKVRAWGNNNYGVTNVPATVSNVVAISAGAAHVLAIKSDGTVVSWGNVSYGQTNIPPGLSNVVAVAGGGSHSLFMIGSADPTIIRQPAPVYALGTTRALLSVGAISSRPLNYQWQKDGQDIPGATNAVLDLPASPGAVGVYRVTVSNELGVVVSSTARGTAPRNTLVTWGSAATSILTVPPGLTEVEAISVGYDHNLVLKLDGTVVGWGLNNYGQTNIPSLLSTPTKIGAGQFANVILQSNGRVAAWGNFSFGLTNVPSTASNLQMLAVGRRGALAMRTNGTLLSWGFNPAPPAGLSNVMAVAVGLNFNLALKPDGVVSAWGENNYGQTLVPKNLTNATAIVSGQNHSLALRTDGSVTGWGLNQYGQCVPPASATNVVAVGIGDFCSYALKADGKVVAWGYNGYGQTTIPASLSNVVSVMGGVNHTLALTDVRSVVIVRQPVGAKVLAGTPTLLSVGARSPQPLQFQWRFNGANLPDATNSWLWLPNPQQAEAGNYSVVVSNAFGEMVSSTAAVSVGDQAPVIARHPESRAVPSTSSAALDVVVHGTAPLTYQWLKEGATVSGGTNATLSFPTPQRADNGYYSVFVSNSLGSALSAEAKLRVLEPQQLSAPQLLPDGSVRLSATDSSGLLTTNDLPFFSVWASTNLVDWALLPDSLSVSNGILWLHDVAAGNHPRRFYRFGEKLAWRLAVPQQITPPAPQPDGSLFLRFGDSNGQRLTLADLPKFQVWASTNLQSWQIVTNALGLTNGMIWLRDPAAANLPQRFYRVIELP